MRVAVSQFATSLNTQENLASCIRVINAAAVCKPDLIVLPEFCNTLFTDTLLFNTQLGNTQLGNTQVANALPCYVDHNQAWQQALAIDGAFLQAIAERAKKHNCYIVINVTLRRDVSRDFPNNKQGGSIKSNISVTSCVFSPLGDLVQQQNKKMLLGHENDFFISADNLTKKITEKITENTAEHITDVVTTPFGKLGLLSGSDSFTFEVSRGLALSGVQLLCNSMNSFALDQSSFHDPARASENKVFLANANKIGLLVPNEKPDRKPNETPDENPQGQSQEALVGVGQSQIISPEGKVLAKITNNEEGFVFADIDLSECNINNKCRPDGTNLIKQRRPELYQQLSTAVKKAALHENVHASVHVSDKVPVTTNVAIFATYKSNEQAIEDVCHYIENNLSDIIQLPELFFIGDKTITDDAQQRAEISSLSQQVIKQVSTVLRPFQYLCTSLIIEGKHQAVLISEHGLLATQEQLHFCQRYQWTELGNNLNIINLPLEQGNIKLAMLTADDANIAEIVKISALNAIHLLLVPFDIQEPCEVEYHLLSRAAENRICIVAASREKSFTNTLSFDNAANNIYNKNKVKSQKSTGLIANLTTDPALSPQWQAPRFNGYINQPLVKHQYGKITKAVIHPIAACTK
ncbi:MAG: carbon-nitrogen hydrolase [Colwellia sp.]|uniref:nitrilase-related carbon-nitrogen hydrolase n=1 Tax=Colwellia sp. TaxID=56799 RepID=UPI0025BA8353|nr:nitrilase-related carbon-nitrogen hydrolase [Colwellia sp.]NQZ27547.1 carbon-nitrogen hydrolase [Colwellia sp.]